MSDSRIRSILQENATSGVPIIGVLTGHQATLVDVAQVKAEYAWRLLSVEQIQIFFLSLYVPPPKDNKYSNFVA